MAHTRYTTVQHYYTAHFTMAGKVQIGYEGSTGKTLYDKLFDAHTVAVEPDGTTVLYIDRHLVHEVTSPQAFEGAFS